MKRLLPYGVATVLCLLFISSNYKPLPAYRDLNKNGRMDVYEDKTQPIEKRIDDILKQMTVEEKAGMMFINGARVNDDGSIDDKPATGMFAFAPNALRLIREKKMNHFNLWAVPSPNALAKWYNRMQKYIEDSTRLGIPITMASDPRNHFSNQIFAVSAISFSQWCEPTGLAAIGDEKLTRQFADISRKEYLAVGIRETLHPQIDLATEPRWPRISGSFSEDAQLSAKMVKAYILGYQGEKLGPTSVATMTKHFPGGGPQKEGLDPHFPFQKGQVYPGKNFNYHLIPFEAAFEAKTAAIMPYYGIPVGQTSEEVAMAYNKDIITNLLRNKYKFDGVVCTDWGLVSDAKIMGSVWPARAWGAENLSEEERIKKIIDAGCDQFGGESCAEHVVTLIKDGRLSEARLNESVKRLLRQKFQLGLFDDPFVDETKVDAIFTDPESKRLAESSQRRAMTLLKNDNNILPLKQNGLKLFVKNINPTVAAKYGTVVTNPADADIAIVRLNTPYYPVESPIMMARMFHHGDLDFKGKDKDSILQILKAVPTIVDINLDRPAVIPEINAVAKGLLADFGASDEAVLDVIFGKSKPGGKLPFELPSSMDAVREQKEDLPYDSRAPLYKFGFGLSYK